jgi:hypothetical protein
VRLPAPSLTNDTMVAWLVEAALRYQRKAISLATLQSLPVIYPFALDQPLGYLLSNSQMLELRSEGPSNQIVALREFILKPTVQSADYADERRFS